MQIISRVVSCCRTHRKKPAFLRATTCVFLVAMLASPQLTGANNTIVRMVTSKGSFNIELYDDTLAPQNTQAKRTVDNFLSYLSRGNYNNSIIHRHATVVPSGVDIIQGGGFICCTSEKLYRIPPDTPIQNEFDPSRSNVRGTIAMAKTSDPDSATSEWFINLIDNSAALDDISNSGGFTVFGRVLDPGMDVVDEIAALDVIDYSKKVDGSPFTELPVSDYIEANGLQFSNFVFVNRACLNNDADGVCSGTEDLAPRGDGNGDGIADKDQANVATFMAALGKTATFSAAAIMKFDFVGVIGTNTAVSWLRTFNSPPNQTANFNNGIFNFSMTGVMGARSHSITLHDGATVRPTHYYAYGPTPDNSAPHWFDFTFDGITGAEIGSDRITLHFVDGMRGDDDLIVNNSITHTGAQAVLTPTTSTGAQSGGCSIAATSSRTIRGGDWIVVSLFLIFMALVRRHPRRQRF